MTLNSKKMPTYTRTRIVTHSIKCESNANREYRTPEIALQRSVYYIAWENTFLQSLGTCWIASARARAETVFGHLNCRPWRRDGHVVRALHTRASVLGPSPSPVESLGNTIHSHSASLHSPANLMLGVTLPYTSIPSEGSRNTHSRFMLLKPR